MPIVYVGKNLARVNDKMKKRGGKMNLISFITRQDLRVGVVVLGLPVQRLIDLIKRLMISFVV